MTMDPHEWIQGNQLQKQKETDSTLLLENAIREDNLDALKALIVTGKCDPKIQDEKGNTPLHLACLCGRLGIVKYLISQNCDSGAENEKRELPLHIACAQRSLEIVKLVSHGVDCNATAINGTPLHIACKSQHSEIIRHLIEERHCDPNIFTYQGELPLHFACAQRSLEIVKLVSGHGVDCNAATIDGTPLHIACKGQHCEIVRYLIEERHCDPNISYSRELPLHVAVGLESLDIVTFVSSYTHDMNATRYNGDTALHIACRIGMPQIVQFLMTNKQCNLSLRNHSGELAQYLACGRKSTQIVRLFKKWVDTTTYSGDSALHIACRDGSVEVVEYLIKEKHCNPTVTNDSGFLPLHYACYRNSLDMIKLVCKCDVNAYFLNGSLNRPVVLAVMYCSLDIVQYLIDVKWCEVPGPCLAIACAYGKRDIVKYLTQRKLCSHSQSWYGSLPLHYACKHSLNMVKLVCDCDVNARDYDMGNNYNNTPVHIACKTGNVDVVKFLVENKKCCTNIKDQHHSLPLHIACMKGSLDIVKLVSSNCDVNAWIGEQGGFSGTPLHIACELGREDIVRYLIQEKNCDTTLYNSKGKTAVDIAIENGRLDIVETITGSTVRCDGNTVLHMASMYASLAVVRELIEEKHYNPSNCNENGDTALHVACRVHEERAEVVSYLLEYCDPAISNNHGELPVHIACRTSSFEVVGLVSNDVDLNKQTKLQKDTPLHIACREGRTDVAEYLLQQCCNPAIANASGHQSLEVGSPRVVEHLVEFLLKQGDHWMYMYTICKAGRLDLVTTFITKHNANVPDDFGNTFLHYACMYDVEESVRDLIECKHSDPTIQNSDGELPLHIACMHGSLGVVKLLCHYINVNITTKSGNTALHLACSNGHLPIVKYLIEQKHCDHLITNLNGQLPLHNACAQSSLEVVKLVSTCNLNMKTKRGDTPLDIAVKKGTLPIVRFLIEEKQCESSSDHSDALLHMACKHNQPEIAQYLIEERSFDPTMPTKDGETPLDIACELESVQLVKAVLVDVTESTLHIVCKHNKPKVLDYLVKERHFEISQCNIYGDSLMHYATRAGAADVVKCLLKRSKCNPTISNKLGEVPLHIASSGSSLEIVKVLATGRVNVNVQTPEGNTPLHVACRHERLEIVEHLVNKQYCNLAIPNCDGELPLHIACTQKSFKMVSLLDICDVNARTDHGNTPLHLACREGVISIVKHLVVERHCDVSIANHDGELPLHIACREQNFEIVELLATVR